MKNKIENVKCAILDRIMTNISDTNKTLSIDTIVSFANIVNMFDKQEKGKQEDKEQEKEKYIENDIVEAL